MIGNRLEPAGLLSSAAMSTSDTPADIEEAIRALDAQRAVLGDKLVDTALGPLRAQLQAMRAAQAREKLRLVSVMFVDLVDSTAMASRLGPEDTHEVVDGTLKRWSSVVLAHGGQVMQYAGDGLLAGFGVHEAREDDAERAVRCGLALQAETRIIATELRKGHDIGDFDLRIGLHTGGVLLAGGVDADYSLRGAVVNIAARLQQTAPTGALRISPDTHAQVRELFEFEAEPALELRGVEHPMRTFLVHRALPPRVEVDESAVDGVRVPLVGRGRELARLRLSFARMQANDRPVLTLLVGDAGLGKSRLLHEFGRWLATQRYHGAVLRGRAHPHTQTQPYGLLHDMLMQRLGIGEGRSMAQARRIFAHALQNLFANDDPGIAESRSHLLGHLVGFDFSHSPHLRGILDDPRQIRARAYHAAALALRQLADPKGLLLLLDDLHWADDESIELLEHVLRVNADLPILVVALARPSWFEHREQGIRFADPVERIDLTPLDADESAALATALLRRLDPLPAVLHRMMVTRSEGNPYYMEELVRMLLDQGALCDDGQRWRLDARLLQTTALPTTLTGVLQARLDGLPAPERCSLQEASVIGASFWDQALAALDTKAVDALPSLTRRGLVRPRGEATQGDPRVYTFGQLMLHEVTYDTLLKRDRRRLHGLAAAWLAERARRGANEWMGAAALHFEQAGDALNASLCHASAAEQARQRFAHASALHHADHALALLDPPPEGIEARALNDLLWRLHDVRERAYDLQARRDEQRAELQVLEALTGDTNDDGRHAELALRRSLLALRSGDYVAAEEAARKAIDSARMAGDDARRLNAKRLLADARVRLGDVGGGEALAIEGLAEACKLGSLDIESRFLNTLTIIDAHRNDLASLLAHSRRATELRGALGDRRNEATGLVNEGIAWLELGALERAETCLMQGLALQRAIGDQALVPISLLNLSQLALWMGQPDTARQRAQQAMTAAAVGRWTDLQAVVLWSLGCAELEAGNLGESHEAFERSLTHSGQRQQRFDALAGLARVALAHGEHERALDAIAPVVALLDAGGSLDGCTAVALVELTAWQVLRATGDKRAAAWLDASYRALALRAEAITDGSLRHGMLQRVPAHRAIVAAWQAQQARRLGQPSRV